MPASRATPRTLVPTQGMEPRLLDTSHTGTFKILRLILELQLKILDTGGKKEPVRVGIGRIQSPGWLSRVTVFIFSSFYLNF